MTAHEHRGELTVTLVRAGRAGSGERWPNPLADVVMLTVCEECGALFVQPGEIEGMKARESERMLTLDTPDRSMLAGDRYWSSNGFLPTPRRDSCPFCGRLVPAGERCCIPRGDRR